MTWREVCIAHDAALLQRWDHTCAFVAEVMNLQSMLSVFGTKQKAKQYTALKIHPFRDDKDEKKTEGIPLTKENFSMLRDIGNLMARK